eukprot:UC1_evm1s2039
MADGLPVQDLLKFLDKGTRADVRGSAVEIVLGITASDDMKTFFTDNMELIDALVPNAGDTTSPPMQEVAFSALVNLSAEPAFATRMVDIHVLKVCLQAIVSEDFHCPDLACMLLSNLTRASPIALALLDLNIDGTPALHRIIDIFCRVKPHNEKGTYHHLALVIFNTTQLPEGRKAVMARSGSGCVIQRLLPFIRYNDSTTRRGGIVGAVRNCCFETDAHDWLLGPEVDILPALLLPLAGPEEFEEEDMEGMPDDLQYLPPDKEREPDADVRKMLLESLLQLCAHKRNRKILRDRKTYYVLREYHKWEKQEDVWDSCHDVIQMLIDDEQPGVDNLRLVDIPKEFTEARKDVDKSMRDGDE